MAGPAILLRRIARRDETAWREATSWLGGLPRMAPDAWPRKSDGTPLHFLAEVDLGALPDGPWPEGLPRTGALVFFGATDLEDGAPENAVLHVAEAHAPCPPPEGTPPLYGDDFWFLFRECATADDAPRAFGRWPVMPEVLAEPDALETSGVAYALLAAAPPVWEIAHRLAGHFRQRLATRIDMQDYARRELDRAETALARLEADPARMIPADRSLLDRLLGRHPQRPNPALADRIAKAAERVGYQQARLADRMRELPEVAAFLAELARRAAPHDRFDPMPDDVVRWIAESIRPMANDMHVHDAVREFMPDIVRDMATAERDVYDRLPEEVRTAFDTHGVSGSGPHQMFGPGREVQGQAGENAANVLLLQLCSDAEMRWMWGDVGVLQFWITPADLAAGRLDRTFLTFAGH